MFDGATTPLLAPRPGGVGTLASWNTLDGEPRLASSGTDGTIRIWDPERGVGIGTPLIGHTAAVWLLTMWRWSGGEILVSTGEDGTIRTWSLGSGDTTGEPIGAPVAGHDGWVRAVAMWNGVGGSPRLASAGTDGAVRIWDPLRGTMVGKPLVEGHDGLAAMASWHGTEGTRLAVADNDGAIRIWDPELRRQVTDVRLEHGAGLWTMVAWIAADGSPRLASAGNDGLIRVWNPDTGAPVGEPLRGHSGWVPTLVTWALPDGGTRLVSAGTDGTIRSWDVETGQPVGEPFAEFAGSLPTLTLWTASNGRGRLTFVGARGAIRTCDLETGVLQGEPLVGHTAGLWALASWDAGMHGRVLAVSGDDAVIRIVNVETGDLVGRPLVGHTAGVWGLVSWRDHAGPRRLASTGDDGTIRIWRPDTSEVLGRPLTGHDGWVPALASWRRPSGEVALVSGGLDGTVRRWDPTAGVQLGEPLLGHTGWVMAVTTWSGSAGPCLASGSADGTIRRWDPETGSPIGEPLTGHTGWVRALITTVDRGGRTLLISASYDGSIRRWDAESGEPVGAPLLGHVGRVAALAAWVMPSGESRLASTGLDGTIRVWDIETGEQIGEPMTGHRGGIWSLICWSEGNDVRLASAGHDGAVRLWDPQRGRVIRTIEVGPVSMWGISDAPTKNDLVGRDRMARVLADQLRRPADAGGSSPAPTVIGIDGPWGCGKTTLMYLVRRHLPPPMPEPPNGGAREQLTVDQVLRQIHRYSDAAPVLPTRPEARPRGVVTAWFNPWAHQSGEQVWAGLANEIIEAAAVVLYPTERERERYWLARNLGRIDRHAIRLTLQRRTRSSILGLATSAAVVAPVAIAIAQLGAPLRIGHEDVPPSWIAILVAVATVIGGVVHTALRRRFGKAAHYLPSELLQGPVLDGLNVGDDDGTVDPAPDPLRRARAGSLYLYQHNIGDIVDDLDTAGYDLVVFVDDLDRCRASTTADVFEAINLFLANVTSRSGLRARFVVGLDSTVVVAHLDSVYGNQQGAVAGLHADDPSPGWAFLRKLIQLPVVVPLILDDGIRAFVDSVTGRDPLPPVADAPAPPPVADAATEHPPVPAAPAAPSAEAAAEPTRLAEAAAPLAPSPPTNPAWPSLELHPGVGDLLVRRIVAQPDRSLREAKRLLNVWQLYVRMLDDIDPVSDPADALTRAQRLLGLSEIVTRWPALQRGLHQLVGSRRGLQLLAAAVDDDDSWRRIVQQLGFIPESGRALVNLRSLLREHDGQRIADLAARLM
ncbi:WD40 repeat protein [Allocatelliglobosispora scoriae]|uniref:WD40 repeat protein n=1 Tax=Allocatelliglobosispora scoriae TaxID=643052 RepID=A0A841BN12_9ACTN|nr:P-loop NTPase fold protein [Allocatelliglobosispora scoriae]MBB5869654.1 WD40 repeat protein [Allocatelliglobosispora scoriae]